jgi:hypothetical protein
MGKDYGRKSKNTFYKILQMTQYINKDALVAEIESYISNYKDILARTDRNDTVWVDFVSNVEAKIDVLQHLLTFIDTIEVKEINE